MQLRSLTVYIVEDDASVRDSLALMLGLAGYNTVFFGDAEGFLAAWHPDWAGCVVADLKLPAVSGIELQAGWWVSSGAVTGVHGVRPGDRLSATFIGIGEVSCGIGAVSG